MKTMLTAFAALAFGACAYAQDTAPASPSTMAPQGMQNSSDAAPAANLTGQTIYSSAGTTIGVIDSTTTDANGQQLAVVRIDRQLGLGADKVLFPTNAIQPRDKGGFMTNLTDDQIRQLPKANATNTTTP